MPVQLRANGRHSARVIDREAVLLPVRNVARRVVDMTDILLDFVRACKSTATGHARQLFEDVESRFVRTQLVIDRACDALHNVAIRSTDDELTKYCQRAVRELREYE